MVAFQQDQVDQIHYLDGLLMKANTSGNPEDMAAYQEAHAAFRAGLLKKIWAPTPDSNLGDHPNRGVRLWDALTTDPSGSPTHIVQRWRDMVLEVQRQIGSLDSRIQALDDSILGRR